MKKNIAEVVVNLPVDGPFDYLLDDTQAMQVSIGQRVSIIFNNRKTIGLVIGLKAKSAIDQPSRVSSVLDSGAVISPVLIKLARNVCAHYGCSLGEAIFLGLPLGLRVKHKSVSFEWPEDRGSQKTLEPAQTLIHDQGSDEFSKTFLGYVRQALDQQKGVIILVPELNDINPCVSFLKKNLSVPMLGLDRRGSVGQELSQWLLIKEGKVRLVVGNRSAVFAPVHALGLIMVVEEGSFAYKQDQSPFYHAREVARMRSGVESCHVVFTAQAPSVELFYLASKKKILLERLPSRHHCQVQAIDLSNYKSRKEKLISMPLLYAMERTLKEQGKILLLINQKGSGHYGVCTKCHFVLRCPRCDVNLTYVHHVKKVVCRLCNYSSERPSLCPSCQGAYLSFSGAGSEKLENEIVRLFPSARVSRYEKGSQELTRDFDVVVATQAILGANDRISFDLTGVVQADQSFHHLNLNAGWEALSLFTKLRKVTTKQLMLQTRLKENTCLQALIKNDFSLFYRNELTLRKELKFPPFWHLIEIVCRSVDPQSALSQAQCIYQSMVSDHQDLDIDIFEPQADAISRLRDQYRFVIVIKTKKLLPTVRAIRYIKKTVKKKGRTLITVNVDP